MIEGIIQLFHEAEQMRELAAEGLKQDQERVNACREKIEEARRLLQSLK